MLIRFVLRGLRAQDNCAELHGTCIPKSRAAMIRFHNCCCWGYPQVQKTLKLKDRVITQNVGYRGSWTAKWKTCHGDLAKSWAGCLLICFVVRDFCGFPKGPST